MTALAPTLEAFFVERSINQKDASPRTIAAYRDTLKLLLRYASERTGTAPSKLDFADLDATAESLRSSITSNASAGTPPGRATRGWRRSTRSTGSLLSGTPSMRTRSHA